MLVTFSTDAYPNISLFGDDAHTLLKMMGHSATVPGSIRAENVAEALGLLKAAIAADKTLPSVDARDAKEPVVSIAHRGMPLIDLLAAAAKANDYVMWNTSTIVM